MPGAVRFTLLPSPVSAGSLDDALSEALAGIECSWADGPVPGTVSVWSSRVDAAVAREALLALAGSPAPPCQVAAEVEEEERDFVEEAAALRRPVAVGPLLLDPHDGARATSAGHRRRLLLPAARAFGTGSHESTRLAVRILVGQPLAGRDVLDVGCGNGVLSLAARLLGARRAVGLDLDPEAAVTARGESLRNGVAGTSFLAGPVRAIGAAGRFDFVVANMLQEEVAPLLGEIAGSLVSGGTLVTSGQLLVREAEFDLLLSAAGFRPFRRAAEGEWGAAASRLT